MECVLTDILRDEHNLRHNADIIAEKWEIFASIFHLYQQWIMLKVREVANSELFTCFEEVANITCNLKTYKAFIIYQFVLVYRFWSMK